MCEEHLIPKAIGGILTCKFLCNSCNSQFGHNLEATAKLDPWILRAAENLSEEIPELSKRLIESYPHIGYGGPNPVSGYIQDNEFHVKFQKFEDGSTVHPTADARKSIATSLQRKGESETSIQKALEKLDEAREGEELEIAPHLKTVKWPVQKVEHDISKGQPMDKLIPAKVAFEFLALYLGTDIYDNRPQLSEVRRVLTTCTLEKDIIQVERLHSNECEPLHGIRFEENDPHAKIQIMLFGSLAFRVHFFHLSLDKPHLVYTHKLDTGKEFWSTIGN